MLATHKGLDHRFGQGAPATCDGPHSGPCSDGRDDDQGRGEQRDDSDVEVLVDFVEGGKTFNRFMGLAVLLEDLLVRRVELVTNESLSHYLGTRIQDEVQYVALAA